MDEPVIEFGTINLRLLHHLLADKRMIYSWFQNDGCATQIGKEASQEIADSLCIVGFSAYGQPIRLI